MAPSNETSHVRSRWIRAVEVADLDHKPRVVNHPPRQIAVFMTDGHAWAIDNRCPHEGYPLASGTVDQDCVLTCNWHNWKFRLSDGKCLVGGDHVRSYPTKIEDGALWIDISDPPIDVVRKEILRGLETAFGERDFGRICREIARLHYHGLDPVDGLRAAIGWSSDRLEFGTTHAMAAAPDWLALATGTEDGLDTRLIPTAEAIDHLAFDTLRQPAFPFPEPSGEPFSTEAFLDSIEAEDRERAEALALRALDDGLGWVDLEQTFAQAALAHYNDFGHSLIYVAKAGELIARLPGETTRALVPPLARSICYAFREDLIPEFRGYRTTLERLPTPPSVEAGLDRPAVPFPATTKDALDWLAGALASFPAGEVYDRLLEALAQSLLHYDTRFGMAYEGPVTQNVSWLDFTHGLTFANAARTLCTRYPRLWSPALTQMACFLGRNHPFILKEDDLDTNSWIVPKADEFFAGIHEKLLDHGFRDPIFSAHLIKTTMAVEREFPVASPTCREALLAGLNRFLASPIKTKHVRRLARQAIELVARDFAASHPNAPSE